MIIQRLYISESSSPLTSIVDYDLEIMKFLVERYGIEAVINQMNDNDIKAINEGHSYYGSSGGNFDRTGGARVRGIGGAAQALPSFLLTAAISWPTALLAAVGALSYRIQKKYQDPDSWLNRANPRFWVDYLANPHKDKKSHNEHSKDSSSFWDKTKSALGIGGAAGAGAAAGAVIANKDDDKTPEEIKSEDFKEYWYTLSNGEILRVRADSEEHATVLVNLIIAYTKRTYEEQNAMLTARKGECARYTFYFNDGEMCYWCGKTKDAAYKEALKSRKELAETFNKTFTGIVEMNNLSIPEIEGEVEISRTEKIPVPEKDKFLNITTVQPRREHEEHLDLPKPVYHYEDLEHYRLNYANFSFNVPASRESEAIEMIRELNHNNENIEKIYNRMIKRLDMYRIVMGDGDIYYIPGDFPEDAKEIAKALWKQKIAVIDNTLQSIYKDEFIDYFDKYRTKIANLKSIEKSKNYNIKKGDEGRVRLMVTGDEPDDKSHVFRLE